MPGSVPLFTSGGASTVAQIPVYENPETEIKPNPAGAEAAAQEARRIGPTIREGGEAIGRGLASDGQALTEIMENKQRLLGNQELSKGWEDFSTGIASLHDQYDKMRMGVTDPHQIDALQGQFLEQYKTAGQEFINGLKTPFAKEHLQDMVRGHYDEFLKHIKSDNAEFLAIGVKTSVEKSLDKLGSTVFSNPSMLPLVMSQSKETLEKLYSNLPDGAGPRVLAEKEALTQSAMEHVVKQAIEGTIRKGGDPAPLMQKYGQYVKNPDEFLSKFESEKRAERSDQMLKNTMDRIAREDAQTKAEFGYRDLIKRTPDGQYSIPTDLMERARHDPAVSQSGFQALDNYVFRLQMQSDKVGEVQAYNKYTEAVIAGQMTQADILRAEANPDPQQRINHEQAQQLKSFLDGPDKMTEVDKMGFQAVKEVLTDKLNPTERRSPDGAVAYQQALGVALQRWSVGLHAGLSRNDLLNPESKDYILRGVDLNKFKSQPGDAFSKTAFKEYTTQQTKEFQKVINDAVGITNAIKSLGPDGAATYLSQHGYNIDPHGPWCAQLVNTVLEKNGFKTTGSSMAASFKGWGFEVPPQEAKAGDVFYSPSGVSQGYSGHVGFTTGKSKMENGELMLEVVSSHLKGSSLNGGGVEYRPARELMIKRAQPSVASIWSPSDDYRGISNTFKSYMQNPGKPQAFRPEKPGESE